jgi:ribosomal protein L11 methyltransferase
MADSSSWLEISVQADAEAAEAVAELFNRYGRGGAVLETALDLFDYELDTAPPPDQVIVKTYLPLDGTTGEQRRRLEEGLWHLGQIYPLPEAAIRELAETDWAEAWKEHYHLLRFGRRLVVVPAWEEHDPAPGEVTLRLEPGMAFGTGLHPTTRLCLEAIDRHLRPGSAVLDVGTGSGILAIAAARLGAGSVLALDADPQAVTVAGENVALNGVAAQVTVQHGTLPGGAVDGQLPFYFAPEGSLALLAEGEFDLLLVNILAPVIVGMAPALAARLAPGGRLVVAGLIDSQERQVAEALEAHHLQIVGRSDEKDWVCLIAQRG